MPFACLVPPAVRRVILFRSADRSPRLVARRRRGAARRRCSACAPRAWVAPSPPWPTMPRRRGGTRRAWAPGTRPARLAASLATPSSSSGTHQTPRFDRDASGLAVPAVARRHPGVRHRLSRPRFELLPPENQRNAAVRPLQRRRGAIRQDPGTADVRLRSLVLNQFGATVGQSFGRHLVVGSTVKLLRGSVGSRGLARAARRRSMRPPSWTATGETHVGLDVGAMASFGLVRAGLMVRNVHETDFGSGADAVTLRSPGAGRTRVHVGSARRQRAIFTAALDADLTTATTVVGDERRVAAGAEGWLLDRRVGVRGGVSASTVGGRRSRLSGGLSAAVRRGTYVDAEVTGGRR